MRIVTIPALLTTLPRGAAKMLSHRTPYLVLAEDEFCKEGGIVPTTTVFLTASPCPIGCRMCDLHRHTLPGPTPVGAIPTQIDVALSGRSRQGWLKLYNSGNFFDPQSIPTGDYKAIAQRCEGFSRLVVENHPRFGAERLRQFRDQLPLRLEVAVGLETVQPRWLDRLAKQMTRDDFDRYAKWLSNERVDLRVFLIVGVPGVTTHEATRWARLSVRHAIAASARHISLIPARFGEGWSGLGEQLPTLSAEVLSELQCAAILDAKGAATVTIDLWDIDRADPGFDELQRRNLTQNPV